MKDFSKSHAPLARIGLRVAILGGLIGAASGCMSFDPLGGPDPNSGYGAEGRGAPIDLRDPSAIVRGGPGGGLENADPRFPPPFYVVQPGDTLFAIASAYSIPLRALIDANRIPAPFDLEPGQRLRLPPPFEHRVREGETLESLAAAYSIDARSLALLNRLPKPFGVKPGDRIILPIGATRILAGQRTGLGPPSVQRGPVPAPGALALDWPARGAILTKFGPQDGKKRSDGIAIEAALGAPVRAAADGLVVYAGDDLANYGNLVLIKHDGRIVTAYAHAARILVGEGQRVRRGDPIAQAGQTGGVSRPQVQFQVRSAGEPLDPLRYLPA